MAKSVNLDSKSPAQNEKYASSCQPKHVTLRPASLVVRIVALGMGTVEAMFRDGNAFDSQIFIDGKKESGPAYFATVRLSQEPAPEGSFDDVSMMGTPHLRTAAIGTASFVVNRIHCSWNSE